MRNLPNAPVATPAYHVYGLTLAGDFPFTNLSPIAAQGPPDLTITLVAEPPLAGGWEEGGPVQAARYYLPDGTPFFTLYRLPDGGEVLRFASVADFYLWPSRIACHLLDPARALTAELYLLSTVLAYWAERRGVPMLHAAAVVTAGGAVGFLATSGAGKSSLAATFVQAGHPLLTDDILPMRRADDRWLGVPGYPQMRMWPEVAARFLGCIAGLPRVSPRDEKLRVRVGPDGFGHFCDRAQPLAALYLPSRRDPALYGTEIDITPVPAAEAVFSLIEHSFASFFLYEVPNQRERLALLAPLARRIPVRRLIYPSGYEHLPRVRQAALEDLARSRPRRSEPAHSGGASDA